MFARNSRTSAGRFALHYRDTQLVRRRLNVGGETPFKAGLQTVFERLDATRRTVAGQHDLLVIFVERVKGVEKFLLRRDLTGYKLRIVYQQHIRRAVLAAELFACSVAYRVDQLVCKVVALDIYDLRFRAQLGDAIHYRVEQMRFSESARTVYKQRIVLLLKIFFVRIRAGGIAIRDREARRMSEFIRASDNEIIKGSMS